MLISGTMILLLMVSCRKPTQRDYYDFDFQKPPGVRQLIWRSSDIVVGTVGRVNVIREGVPASKQPGLLMDQIRADVNIENVLLGDMKQPRVAIEFFGYSLNNPGGYSGPPPLMVASGERRIFFLTQDSA